MTAIKREHLVIVDVLTLMATILVVMGHHKFLRGEVDWYYVYDKIIYSFHMGFFMAISGFLIKYTFPEICCWRQYIGKKAKKFIPAYLLVGLLAALVSFTSVANLGKDVLMLIVNPLEGPIQIIWYIYVLLMYYCLAPFIFKLSIPYRRWLLALSLIPAAFYTCLPNWFCLSQFFRLLPFFLLGTHLADNYKKIRELSDWKVFLLGIPFLVMIVCRVLNINILSGWGGKIVTSAMSLPAMYWIARKLVAIKGVARASTRFSSYVYPVYLWQMFFINGLWIIWQRLHCQLNDSTAVVYLLCSVVFTILGIVAMIKVYRKICNIITAW